MLRLAVDLVLKMPKLSPSNSFIPLMLAYRLATPAMHNLPRQVICLMDATIKLHYGHGHA